MAIDLLIILHLFCTPFRLYPNFPIFLDFFILLSWHLLTFAQNFRDVKNIVTFGYLITFTAHAYNFQSVHITISHLTLRTILLATVLLEIITSQK